MSAIELDDVGVRLGAVTALHGASLHTDARSVAVIGDNGSGKSTLARVLAGLVPADQGRARVLGLDPGRDASALRRLVAVVFSDPDAQIVMPTVAEDVAFSLRALRHRPAPPTDPTPPAPRDHARARPKRRFPYTSVISRREDASIGRREGQGSEERRAGERARVAATLERFGLADLADRSAHELSGGQKQLLALAGAFVREPELVIADEPTAALDARNARLIAGHLLRTDMHRLVLVTHDLTLAARCEQVVHVADGTIVDAGDADAVIAGYERTLAC